jgi:hypothetical protein
MANKKISQQTNNITTLNDDVWIRAIENQSTIPTDGYIKATQFNSSSDIITDGVNTFVDVSTGQFIGMKFGLASGYGLTLKNASDVEIVQIDENGDIWNNGGNIIHCSGTSSLFIGTRAPLSGYLPTAAVENTVVGRGAGDAITSGDQCTIMGHDAGSAITISKHNSLFGADAGRTLTGEKCAIFGSLAGADLIGHDNNAYFGYATGNTNRGDNCAFFGYGAGARQTVSSNMLLIDNQFRASEALELTDSLIYGVGDPIPANQLIRINGLLELTQINSGATQVAAGAGPNEVWKTASHATLPDNVLMIGV